MKKNAYILDWTMNDYDNLLASLKQLGLNYEKESEKNHVRVDVPFSKINPFVSLVQKHLNAPFNYVDIQYPKKKKSIIVFQKNRFNIESDDQNEVVRKWAIDLGLPPAQADWDTSY